MADNIPIEDANYNIQSIATEEISGSEYQVVKIAYGPHGTATKVDDTNRFPVSTNLIQPTTPFDIQGISGSVDILNFPTVQIISAIDIIPVSGSFSSSPTDIQFNGTKVTSANPLPISGNLTTTLSNTIGVSGSVGVINPQTVVGISGNPSFNVSNSLSISSLPNVVISNPISSVNVLNYPSIQGVSGSINVNTQSVVGVSSIPNITISNPISAVNVLNLPNIQTVSGNVSIINPVSISAIPNVVISNPVTVVGLSGNPSITVSNPVSSVNVTNLPAVQTISGTVNIVSAGLSTSLLQISGNSYLASLDNKTFLGQQIKTSSTSVVLASDHQSININGVVGISGSQTVSGNINVLNQIGVSSIPNITVSNPVSSVNILNYPSIQGVSGSVNTQPIDLQYSGNVVSDDIPLPVVENLPLINYWPAMNGITSGKDTAYVDPSGALQVRGAVTTDEGSYSTDFNGIGSYYLLSGVTSFTNGSNKIYGSGTSFLSQLTIGDYVRLISDPSIQHARVDFIDSDTEATLDVVYPGTTSAGQGVYFGFELNIGNGGNISVSGSYLTIDSGVSANAYTFVSRDVDFQPTAAILRNFKITQNINNNDTFFGFFDTNNYLNYNVGAYVLFDGLSVTNGKLITKTSNSPEATTEVYFTVPAGVSLTNFSRWRLEITDDQVTLYCNDLITAVSRNHLPPIYKPLLFIIGTFNTNSPASNTTIYVDELLFKNVDVVNTASSLQTNIQYSADITAQTLLQELAATLNTLTLAVRALTNNQAMSIDINGRQRINVETGTVTAAQATAANLNATVSLAASQTLATLTNQAQVGGYQANDEIPAMVNNNALGLRTGIIVT